MKTSEKLLAALDLIHQYLQLERTKPATLNGWNTRLIAYISAAVPVALWLESVDHEPTLSQLIEMKEVEELVYKHDPVHGTVFFAICAPLRHQLTQIPHFSTEKLGNQLDDACMSLGYLSMQIARMVEGAELGQEAKRRVNIPATTATEFGALSDDGFTGWFKAHMEGPWLLRRGSSRATRLTEKGHLEEFTFAETDTVFA